MIRSLGGVPARAERTLVFILGLAVTSSAMLSATFLATVSHAEQRPAGTEFWFAWPRTSDVTGNDPTYDLDGELIVLTRSTTPVPFEADAPGFFFQGSAVAGSPGRVRVPRALMLTTSGIIEAKGIHVASSGCEQVAALFRVPGSRSSVGDDVMALLPSTVLGTDHWPETYHGLAEFAVVATQDGTHVTYDNPHCPGAVDVTLDRGEVIEHLCDDERSTASQRGITGTHVLSDKPVAVVAGSAASNIVHYLIPSFPTPVEIIWCCADILLETVRPTSDWEREYGTVPFVTAMAPPVGDVIDIIAACAGTDVTVDDGTTVQARTLAAGESWELVEADLAARRFSLTKTPAMITASKPIQVTQYSVGWQMTADGDPSQATVPGLLRPAGTHVFFIPEQSEGHANIVAPLAAVGLVALDGAALPAASWTAYRDGRHAWTRVGPLLPGEHVVASPDVPVSVLAYGISLDSTGVVQAGEESYPAPSFAPGGAFPVLVQPDDLCASHCATDCLTLDAGPGYASYAWSTGQATPSIRACPTSDTVFTVDVLDSNGCPGVGVIDVPVLAAPQPTVSGAPSACEGGCTQLSVQPGFAAVAWSTGDTSDTTTVCPTQSPTTVTVHVTDAAGCGATGRVDVQLYLSPLPPVAVAADVSPCGTGVQLSWSAATWLNQPAGGIYHVYRSTTDCASAVTAPPIASALTGTSWLDLTTIPGGTYAYVVMAEDATAATGCGNGPDHGGLTATACITGVLDGADGAPPAPGEGFSLRGAGHAGTAITFRWDAAPPLDAAAGEHFHFSRSTSAFGPFVRLTPEGYVARAFTDPAGADAPLLFYELRVADGCENETLDPEPPTPCHGNACQAPELAASHPFSWDTCSPGCGSAFGSHACGGGTTDGRDRVHWFDTPVDGPVHARLRGAPPALGIFLYDATLSSCLARGATSIDLPMLAAGRHAIVVDGPAGSEGSYAIEWSAAP